MTYRTMTYIAADWDGDSDAVDQLYRWKEGKKWSLSFTDAHELTQARDTSLKCSIKSSLKTRLEASKTFVLIVGNNTSTVRSGRCQYCDSYNSYFCSCKRGYSVDLRSYIEYECDKAIADGMKIVVLYNAAMVNRTKCPESVKQKGTHVAMCYRDNNTLYWDYNAVKEALNE